MFIDSDNIKLTRAVHLLNQSKLSGLIIYSDGSYNILHPAYFRYFSEIRPIGKSAVVISTNGRLAIIVEPESAAARIAAGSWISDVRCTCNIAQGVADILREFKIENSIGIVGTDEMTADVYDTITQIVIPQLADSIIENIAREKTRHELEVVKEAARIADIGFKAFLKNVRTGIKEYELAAETGYAMRAAGAEDIFMLISSERHNLALHRPLDKRLLQGDIVIVEMAPFCEGQCVQVCRTVYLGKPDNVLEEKYALLIRAFTESLKQIKPGLPAFAMSRAMNNIITDAGYGEYCRPPHMRARGHGFGVGSISPGPVIDDDTNVILERHRVLISHPNQYFPETGYLACGETVLVTDSGYERLLHTETRLYAKEV
jgi:Xaa-Pro dipeptidase